MAEDKGSKVPLREGAPIPNMQPIQSGGTEKKGAPIPNMQPVPGSQSQPGSGHAGGSSGHSEQTNSRKQKQK